MPTHLISMARVIELISLSRTEVYRRIKAGTFPQPVPLGPFRVAFVAAEVDGWIAERLTARDAGEGATQRVALAKRAIAARRQK